MILKSISNVREWGIVVRNLFDFLEGENDYKSLEDS